jgi:2-keto-3-deoxygluconate permease
MDVVHRMRKIPAGLFIIPMILGAIINTFFKGFLSAGGFITAMFKDGTPRYSGNYYFIFQEQLLT